MKLKMTNVSNGKTSDFILYVLISQFKFNYNLKNFYISFNLAQNGCKIMFNIIFISIK